MKPALVFHIYCELEKQGFLLNNLDLKKMIKVNGVLSTVFLINFHFLLLVKLIECIVKKKNSTLAYSSKILSSSIVVL